MIAIGVDPDNQLVPLAFALAEGENNDSWCWFLKLVRQNVLHSCHNICMISNRHHSLLTAMKEHVDGRPPLEHRWCMRNFAANICLIGNNCKKMHKSKQISKSITHISDDSNACGKRPSP